MNISLENWQTPGRDPLAESEATRSNEERFEVLVSESSVYSRRGEDKLFVVSNEYLTINNASPGNEYGNERRWEAAGEIK